MSLFIQLVNECAALRRRGRGVLLTTWMMKSIFIIHPVNEGRAARGAEQSRGGLFIPDTAKEKPQEGRDPRRRPGPVR